MILIGVGSNLASREYASPCDTAAAAVAALPEIGAELVACSHWYSSQPVPARIALNDKLPFRHRRSRQPGARLTEQRMPNQPGHRNACSRQPRRLGDLLRKPSPLHGFGRPHHFDGLQGPAFSLG